MRHDRSVPMQPPKPRQRFAQNVGFVAKLQFVGNVLIVASAAYAEVWTGRNGAIRRRRLDLRHAAANEFFARLHRLDGYALVRQDERGKHGVAFVMRKALAAIDQFLDAYVDGIRHESFQFR